MSVTSDKSQDPVSQQATIKIKESEEIQQLFKRYELPTPIVDMDKG